MRTNKPASTHIYMQKPSSRRKAMVAILAVTVVAAFTSLHAQLGRQTVVKQMDAAKGVDGDRADEHERS